MNSEESVTETGAFASPNESAVEHKYEIEEQLVHGFDDMLFMMMRFTKKQLLKELVDDTKVTPPQFGLLWCLSGGHSQTMSEISENMELTHGAATGLVERLQKQGLIERIRSDEDRRVVRIEITADGRELVERVHDKRRRILKKMLECLSLEERQLLLKIDAIMKDMLIKYAE